MIPEFGSFALCLSLALAFLQSVMGLRKPNALHYALTRCSAYGQALFLGCSMLILITCFLLNDMSVIYVREHSHQLLPLIYRIGAAWGGHEGSLLLWCCILIAWTLAFILFSARHLPLHTAQRILAILGLISGGFLTFLLMTSNPFARNFPTSPINGEDLTPILQDPGLIFHPPMLYLGYVGFALAFAFALTALIEGQISRAWVRACRPWVILPWAFLSMGIVLGSSWAYHELGWGGWWFWDPVENASLLPWLSATALLHTLIVCEKRDTFYGWALLLAIITFTLSLIGTFLVRSGVLVSVHTFANDPGRGLFLLVYLSIIIGGALTLYAARIHRFYRPPHFSLLSRESFLLINSIFLLTAIATILLGTLYPIVLDALDLTKLSVGEPYFNTLFLPIMLPLLLLMGLAPHMKWQHQRFMALLKRCGPGLILSGILGTLLPLACDFPFHLLTALSLSLALWLALGTLQYALRVLTGEHRLRIAALSMITAHLGIAVLSIGVTLNKSYSEERQVRMQLHDRVTLAGYTYTLTHLADTLGPNYKSVTATFAIQHTHQKAMVLQAEQRIYTSHEQLLSKPGIVYNLWRDLYLALGSPLSDGGWSVRLYYKPFVRWIWAGGFMLMIGGLLSLLTYAKKRDDI